MTVPVEPRPAATVLLVRDDPFEVLMVRRSAVGPFPDVMVFPGGTVDASDHDEAWLPHLTGAEGLMVEERALRIAALRETFEEVGLFVGVDAEGRPAAPAACDASDFRALVVASDARLPLDVLVPLARWVTPERAPRRWDTHFFLCRAPIGQSAVCDDVETMAPQWLAPDGAIALAQRNEHDFLLPTRMNLTMLARSEDSEAALGAARQRPVTTVLPRIERRADGNYAIIPLEAGYGIGEIFHSPLVNRPAA